MMNPLKSKAAYSMLAGVAMVFAASPVAHAAGSVSQTVAKVIKVTQTQTRNDPNFGPFILMTIEFDRAIGTGCTSNTMATAALFQLADNAARDQNIELLGGMRQLATAALLSGRNVLVQTAGNCSPIGGQNLDFVQLQ